MSGRRQHYLPQFLQRNFSSKKSAKEHYVFAHRKGASFQPNTGSIGHERDFYGHPERSIADDNITRAEAGLADIVSRLVSDDVSSVTQDELALLVTSLSLRTKKMREALKEASHRMIAAFGEMAESTDLAEREFDKFFADKEGLARLVDEELAKAHRIDRNKIAQLKTLARNALIQKARQDRSDMLAQIRQQFAAVVERLVAEAANIADRAFLKVFETTPAPEARLALFKEMRYSIVEAPEGQSFILGDCAVVSLQSDSTPKLALGDIDDGLKMSEVWLPIAPRLAVVGRRGDFKSALDVAGVNRLSAMLSHDFFISDSMLEEHAAVLKNLIGSADPLLTREELSAISALDG